jgi:hypothetical protein
MIGVDILHPLSFEANVAVAYRLRLVQRRNRLTADSAPISACRPVKQESVAESGAAAIPIFTCSKHLLQ